MFRRVRFGCRGEPVGMVCWDAGVFEGVTVRCESASGGWGKRVCLIEIVRSWLLCSIPFFRKIDKWIIIEPSANLYCFVYLLFTAKEFFFI